jgi:hypothetical protein
MTVFPGESFPSDAALCRHQLQVRLDAAEKNVMIRGWHAEEIRKQLESVITQGVEVLVHRTGSERMVLVHVDF